LYKLIFSISAGGIGFSIIPVNHVGYTATGYLWSHYLKSGGMEVQIGGVMDSFISVAHQGFTFSIITLSTKVFMQ
jgi:hypothetical protein